MTVILASNRLPISLTRKGRALEITENLGGVATGLGAVYQEHRARWVGWPGEVLPGQRGTVARRLREEFDCVPVFLPPGIARRYYAGFSNRTLWPLLHSFSVYARFSKADWDAYRRANALFAKGILEFARPDDTIWIHDYHLFLLPALLRKRLPEAKIGFFLHVPFPPYDTWRLLPWSRELLRGVLGADLIGFHTYDYVQAFLSSVRRLVGLDNEIGNIVLERRIVQVDAFPMGIEFERFSRATVGPAVDREMDRVRRRASGRKLAFSISRLDYTKGIPQQLQAVQRFLEQHPKWRSKFVYLLAVTPSREHVPQYVQLKRQIDELVGRINSRYGDFHHTPIHYVYRALSFEQLLALYRSGDVALIAPLRDGMNLVAKEYLASRTDERGVLILSEMAGASKELLEALLVNPYDTEELVAALHAALTMPAAEQVRRNRAMRSRLAAADVDRWAERFLRRLDEATALSKHLSVRILTSDAASKIAAAYAASRKRLLLLDYDGSLVPFTDSPAGATPPGSVLAILKALARPDANEVVLVSGRGRDDLDRWFSGIGVTLVAEHGAWVRAPHDASWRSIASPETSWKDRIRPILEGFEHRVPGSYTEEKDYSLAWHYRRADIEIGSTAARELIDTLTGLTANLDLHVLPGSRVVEVKSTRVGKGAFFASEYRPSEWDFILAAGDDITDETLFAALPPDAHTIRVGFVPSAARYNVGEAADLVAFLGALAKA